MQRFFCEHCANEVDFEASSCPVCSTHLGYVPEQQMLRELTPSGDGVSYALSDEVTGYWRCLNAAWGCNWVLPVASGAVWCRSCALTRGRPDDARPDAIDAWALAEASKRRLVYQLDQLALPIEPRSPAVPEGLAFDLVYLPGQRGLTGHLDGVVTLDLTEADPVVRDELRRRLNEPYRTLIGNLRHEIAHHYWHLLVGQSEQLARFRHLFGDERAAYTTALEQHYAGTEVAWDERRFVTRYAQAHPHEDWAETFAHYLHLADLVDTAAAHGLIEAPPEQGPTTPAADGVTYLAILQRWRPVARAIDDIAHAVGSPGIYPFDPAGAVVEKLEFVHMSIRAHTDGGQLHDDPVGERHPEPDPRSTNEESSSWQTSHLASTSRRSPGSR